MDHREFPDLKAFLVRLDRKVLEDLQDAVAYPASRAIVVVTRCRGHRGHVVQPGKRATRVRLARSATGVCLGCRVRRARVGRRVHRQLLKEAIRVQKVMKDLLDLLVCLVKRDSLE
jgi:hypothetical protein